MAERSPQFVAEEVWQVAQALVDNHVDEDVAIGRNAYHVCRHCGDVVFHNRSVDSIQHNRACVVLVARDLLTGAPRG